MPPIELTGEICALAAALSWAFSVVLFKRSESVSPLGLNLFKNVAAIALLTLTLPAIGAGIDTSRSTEDWARLALSGLLGIAIADTLFFMALRRLGAALLAVVDCIYAPTIVVLSVMVLGESVGVSFLAGAALVLAGVLLATIDRAPIARATLETADGRAARREKTSGVVFGVLAIFAMAIGVILAKPALARGHLVEVSWIRLVAGVAGQLVWMASVPDHRRALEVLKPSPVWRTLLPAAVLGSYVSMLAWLGGFKWAAASTAAVLNQTTSVFTIILARVFLAEPLTVRRAIGGGIAIAGALTVMLGR